MRWRGPILVVFIVAGCVDTPVLSDPPTGSDLRGYERICKGSDTWMPNADVCAAALSNSSVTRTEGTMAIHPTRAGTRVIGFNAMTPNETTPAPTAIPDPLDLLPDREAEAIPCPRFGMCFHVTEDDGATWREFGLPPIAGGFASHDPTPLFLGDRLVVAGLFQADLDEDNRPTRGGLFVLTTDDLGLTWREERFVREGWGDRPWLSRLQDGSAVLTWMEGLTVGVARSSDRGATWQIATPMLECRWQSRALDAPDGFWVVCGYFSPAAQTLAVRFDTSLRVLSRHEWTGFIPIWPFVGATAGGGFVMIGEGYETGNHQFLRVAPDGSAGKPIAWFRGSEILAAWNWSHLLAAEIDGYGAMHVLVAGGNGERCDNSWCDDFRNRQIAHIVLDAEDGALVEERLLTPADGRARPDDANARRAPLQDDVSSIGVVDGGVILVWSHYWRAESTFARPLTSA